jgi:hypothetical protein
MAIVCGAACVARAQVGPDGWTAFTASPDSRVVYVSATGNDANSGLSSALPKRTLAAGAALVRDGYPDWLLLKSGESWSEVFPSWTKGGRSATEPMRIAVYGGLSRAVINCGTARGISGFIPGMTPKSHLAVTDLAFVADGYTGSNSSAAGVEFLGSWTDVLLENVSINGFLTNLVFQSDRTQQLMQDIRVRRCVIVDSYTTGPSNSEGCYIAGVDRLLLEECVFDHNGWNESVAGAVPNMFRHNIYIQGHDGNYDDCTNVTTRGLISARAAATGMQQRPGGVCENSLFINNPLNVVFGTTGGTVTECVVVGSRDIDGSTPRGVGYNLVQGGNMTATRCVAVGGSMMGTQNVIAYAIDTATNVVLQSCVSWHWKSAAGVGVAVSASNAPWPTVVGGDMEQSAPTYTVSVEAYMSSLGQTATVEAYMAQCRLQSRALWRTPYTANGFNSWARSAFGMAGTTPCYANCDGSAMPPVVNISDVTCFMQLYAAGDPRANCDGSTGAPLLSMADFTCFLQRYAAGCQ